MGTSRHPTRGRRLLRGMEVGASPLPFLDGGLGLGGLAGEDILSLFYGPWFFLQSHSGCTWSWGPGGDIRG